MSSNVRLAQVGFGNFGRFMNAKVFPSVPGLTVDQVVVTSKTSQSEIDAVLSRCDAVYVCVQPAAAPALVEFAISRHKAVMCEKPLLETDRLFSLSEAADVRLAVGYHRRFSEPFENAKRRAAELGTRLSVIGIESRDPGPVVGAKEIVMSSVSHDVDTAAWILGEGVASTLRVASAKETRPGEVAVELEAPQGVRVSITCSRKHPSYLQNVSVNGEQFGKDTPRSAVPHGSDGDWFFFTYVPAYIAEFRWFVDVVSGRTRSDPTLFRITARLLDEITSKL